MKMQCIILSSLFNNNLRVFTNEIRTLTDKYYNLIKTCFFLDKNRLSVAQYVIVKLTS